MMLFSFVAFEIVVRKKGSGTYTSASGYRKQAIVYLQLSTTSSTTILHAIDADNLALEGL